MQRQGLSIVTFLNVISGIRMCLVMILWPVAGGTVVSSSGVS